MQPPPPPPAAAAADGDPYVHAGGRCASWGALARVCAAEVLGTALLVLAGSAPLGPQLAPLQAGLTVGAIVQCFGGISGAQVNPCVTLAALLGGRMGARRAAGEAAAQLAGAALGALAAAELGADPRAALTLPALRYPVYKAVCVEALCGAVVVLANCASWEAGARAADSWPLRIGGTVAALAAVAGPLTGASMNPARSFGPALVANVWGDHWVYWVGPLCGAGAAAVLHRAVWRAPRPPYPHRPQKPPALGTP